MTRQSRTSRKPTKKSSRPAKSTPRRTPKKTSHEIAAASNDLDISSALNVASSEVWALSRIKSFVTDRVDAILGSRQVPSEFINTPRMDIAVPALEAMRYCTLRNEMAALIAASMDGRFAHRAHPSFVNILRQLTRDELILLASMPPIEQVMPLGHVHLSQAQGQSKLVSRNIIPQDLAELCDTPISIPTYIDNLRRLELVTVPVGLKIRETAPYAALIRQRFCKKYFGRSKGGGPRQAAHYQLEKSLLTVTNLGDSFRHTCLNLGPMPIQ